MLIFYKQYLDFIFGCRGRHKDNIKIANEISRCKSVLLLMTWQLLAQKKYREGKSLVDGDIEHLDPTTRDEARTLRNGLVARKTA